MRRLALVVLAIALSGCAATEWAQKRSQCGLRCPRGQHCVFVGSHGVFGFDSDYRCETKPKPSPSPKDPE